MRTLHLAFFVPPTIQSGQRARDAQDGREGSHARAAPIGHGPREGTRVFVLQTLHHRARRAVLRPRSGLESLAQRRGASDQFDPLRAVARGAGLARSVLVIIQVEARVLAIEFDPQIDAIAQRPAEPARMSLHHVHGTTATIERTAPPSAGTRIRRGHQLEACGEFDALARARQFDAAFAERFAQTLEAVGPELGEFVEQQHAAMREGDLARAQRTPSSHQTPRAHGVVGSTQGRTLHLERVDGQATAREDAPALPHRLTIERRQQLGERACEQSLATTGRSLQQQVMPSGGSHHQRALRAPLPLHREQTIGGLLGIELRPGRRRHGAATASTERAQQRGQGSQMVEGEDADRTGITELVLLGPGHHDPIEAQPRRVERERHRATRRTQGSVESEFPHEEGAPQERGPRTRQLPRREEDRQGHREIHRGAVLAQVGRGETQRDAAVRPPEAGIAQCRADPFAALAESGARQPDHREAGQRRGHVGFHPHPPRTEALERGGEHAGESRTGTGTGVVAGQGYSPPGRTGREALAEAPACASVVRCRHPSAVPGLRASSSQPMVRIAVNPDRVVLRARPLDLPLAREFRTARGGKTIAANLLVEIEAEGIVGRGEGAPIPRYGQTQQSGLHALAALPALDRSPLEQEDWMAALDAVAPDQTAARCALEMALWDWAGQKLGRPLHRLLAIDPAPPPPSSWTLSIDDDAGLAARVHECAAWPILKVKLGGGAADRRAVERLRTLTDRPFRVDANEAWTAEEAPDKCAWLAEMGCELVEQPLPAGHLDDVARLRESSPLPLVADEDAVAGVDARELAAAYDGVNVKLTRLGGIRPAVRWIHAARRAGLDLMLGCFVESSVGISAAAHLAPLARWTDLDGAALLARDPFRGATVKDGTISIPSGPGLGILPA